jgi:hypothetical protein
MKKDHCESGLLLSAYGLVCVGHSGQPSTLWLSFVLETTEGYIGDLIIFFSSFSVSTPSDKQVDSQAWVIPGQ